MLARPASTKRILLVKRALCPGRTASVSCQSSRSLALVRFQMWKTCIPPRKKLYVPQRSYPQNRLCYNYSSRCYAHSLDILNFSVPCPTFTCKIHWPCGWFSGYQRFWAAIWCSRWSSSGNIFLMRASHLSLCSEPRPYSGPLITQ